MNNNRKFLYIKIMSFIYKAAQIVIIKCITVKISTFCFFVDFWHMLEKTLKSMNTVKELLKEQHDCSG